MKFNKKARAKDLLKLWGMVVKKRDDYICQQCGETNGFLDPHHIIRKSKGNAQKFDVLNGVCLCRSCHSKFHKFGYEVEYVHWLDSYLAKKDLTFESLKETYKGAYLKFNKETYEIKKKILEDMLKEM